MNDFDVRRFLVDLSNWESAFDQYGLTDSKAEHPERYISDFLDKHPLSKADAKKIYCLPFASESAEKLAISAGVLPLSPGLTLDESYLLEADMNVVPAKQINFTKPFLHRCAYYNAIYVLSGAGRVSLPEENKTGGKTFELKEGDYRF